MTKTLENSQTIIDEIRNRLGERVVLLPHDHKKKEVYYHRAEGGSWGAISYHDTQREDFELVWRRKARSKDPDKLGPVFRRKLYQDELAGALKKGGNLSVLLKGNLCAIDIDDDEEVEPFLELNPFLRQSMITKGKRGVQIWLRMIEDDTAARFGVNSWPGLAQLKWSDRMVKAKDGRQIKKGWGEWRCGRTGAVKSNIWGVHPDGMEYRWLTDYPAAEVHFKDIRWPRGLELAWLESDWLELIAAFGEPWERHEKRPEIGHPNESFWAKRFALKHDVLFEKDEERFYVYNPHNGAWERRSDKEIKVLVGDDLFEVSRDRVLEDLCTYPDDAPVAEWRKLRPGALAALEGNTFRSSGRLSSIVDLVKGYASRSNVFQVGKGIIHLQNGMIDLRADPLVLADFSPKYYSRNPLPLTYRPGAKCDHFLHEYLGKALPADDVDLLQRYFGLVLLGKNTVQKIMMLVGTAGGGKSTLIQILQRLVGRGNISQVRTKHLGERFEMAKFIGKTLLCGSDVKGNFLMQSGVEQIKSLSGGDFIEAELKGGNEGVNFDGEFNMIFSSNSRLKVKLDADSEAYRRRFVIVTFNQPKPEKVIEGFDQWIVDREGSGILAWAIIGALRILKGDRLKVTARQQKVVDDLLDESDSIRVFLREAVQREKGESLLVEDIVEAYFGYCESVGWDAESKGKVEKELVDMMLTMFRAKRSKSIQGPDGKSHIGYRGVKFKGHGPGPDEDEDEQPAPF